VNEQVTLSNSLRWWFFVKNRGAGGG
jgi:hypothetical protein